MTGTVTLLSIIRLVGFIFCANLISVTFLVLRRFTEWDTAATITTIILSVCIIHVKVILKKWNCLGRQIYLNILIASIIMGVICAFFWFFNMIHRVGHYRGDALDTLWSFPTKAMALAISAYLVYTSRREYVNLTMELSEVELVTEESMESLSKSPTLSSEENGPFSPYTRV